MKAEPTFNFYTSGVYACSSTYLVLDHSVQIIGYTLNGDWIIKNSWGTSWGMSGFGLLSSDADKDCGIRNEVYKLYAVGQTGSGNDVMSSPIRGNSSAALFYCMVLALVLMIH